MLRCGRPQQALLPGDCELQQLLHTFQLLGTPTEEIWPGAPPASARQPPHVCTDMPNACWSRVPPHKH